MSVPRYHHRLALPKLRPDLLAAAFPPEAEPHPKWLPQVKLRSNAKPNSGSINTAVQAMKVYDPLYYNSLVDKNTKKHLAKPNVKRHMHHCGFMAEDGAVYPTRQEQLEANRAYRLFEEREAILRMVETRERSRLDRLKKAARAGDITFTRDGIFETKPCNTCDVYHKVASIMNTNEPCPGSNLATRYASLQQLDPLPDTYLRKRSSKVSFDVYN